MKKEDWDPDKTGRWPDLKLMIEPNLHEKNNIKKKNLDEFKSINLHVETSRSTRGKNWGKKRRDLLIKFINRTSFFFLLKICMMLY